MKRWTFNILAAVSLAMFFATATLWVRSYFVRDLVGVGSKGGNSHIVQSILGRIHVLSNLEGGYPGESWHAVDRLSPQAVWSGGLSGYPARVEWHGGFVVQTYSRLHMAMASDPSSYAISGEPSLADFWTRHRLIIVPYWCPALILAILPMAWLAVFRKHRRRRHRLAHGLCLQCGYDLRAHSPGERCPECGMMVGIGKARAVSEDNDPVQKVAHP